MQDTNSETFIKVTKLTDNLAFDKLFNMRGRETWQNFFGDDFKITDENVDDVNFALCRQIGKKSREETAKLSKTN